MNSLDLFHLCKRMSAIPLNRGFRTESVLMGRRRTSPAYEPGISHRKAQFRDEDDQEGIEDFLDEEIDMFNINKAYDMNEGAKQRNKTKLKYMITAKKFFSPRPQPLMLTVNERECIRYLHKQDPVQWNLHTLSESFPATTDTIKKIIRGKWKITPERAKMLDSKAQKNWELLAEGKLDADPKVLEHMKKFINKREVLLEQIKNTAFYLPEVKKEPVWNKGEFSGILKKYEKCIEKFVREDDERKMLEDGKERRGGVGEEKEESSLDAVHKEINEAVPYENKDSFLYGGLTKFYSEHTTLDELEERILKRAEARKKLDVFDKAILETKLDGRQSFERATERGKRDEAATRFEEANPGTETRDTWSRGPILGRKLDGRQSFERATERGKRDEAAARFEEANSSTETRDTERTGRIRQKRFSTMEPEMGDDFSTDSLYFPPDERTRYTNAEGAGKLLEELLNPPPVEESKKLEPVKEDPEKKERLDLEAMEKLRKEQEFFNKEVKDIEDTSFWNLRRTSREKAMAEMEKRPHEGPEGSDRSEKPVDSFILNPDGYPQWIKIPKNKRGTGLTFKVKDCYYDDDGEFLYRVPGMKN